MKIKLLIALFIIVSTNGLTFSQTPTLVKDLQAGSWSTTNRILINNQWFFITDGNKLWRTDGTSIGTTLLKTFGAASVYNFMELNGKLLLFVDDDGDGKLELWGSDGTKNGTVQIKDLQATKWSAANRILINNQWFFATEGNRLWRTDGTSVGTILLKTFASTDIYTFHELNGILLLLADDDGDSKIELWRSDGTKSGTILVKDLQSNSWSASNRLLVNNQWFFAVAGNKLWKTDGTSVGTTLLKTFGGTDLFTFHELNGKLLLMADNNVDGKAELWRSDGTSSGTVEIKDLQAAKWNPANRILINNEWYFATDGNRLWKTDATSAGTTLLKTFACQDVFTFHELNGKLLLFADEDVDNKMELWTSDGTSGGTSQVKDLQASKWNQTNRLLVNNEWFFATDDKRLWKTDGTSSGTTLLKTFGSILYNFHALNNKLLLFDDNDVDGKIELWQSDGTNSGTIQIKDLQAAKWSAANRELINNTWYFATDDNRLWKSNGTATGTTLLKTFSCPSIYTFHQVNDKLLLFADNDVDNKVELWGLDAPAVNSVNEVTGSPNKMITYPNPFSNIITIDMTDSRFITGDLYIYNALGQMAHKQKLNSSHETINLNLASGIYFYKILYNNMEVTATGTIVRE